MLEIVREIVAVTHQPLQRDFNPIVYYFYSSHSMRLHSAQSPGAKGKHFN